MQSQIENLTLLSQRYQLARENPEKFWNIFGERVNEVHETLLHHYSHLKDDPWSPNPELVTLHRRDGFIEAARKLGGDDHIVIEQFGMPAFTTLVAPRKIRIDVETLNDRAEFEMFLAEEMLHAWGLQQPLPFSELDAPESTRKSLGMAAMEKFVPFLAYKAIGVFELTKSIPEALRGQVSNMFLISKLVKLAPEAAESMFKACLTGNSEQLNQIIDVLYEGIPDYEGFPPHVQFYFTHALLHAFEVADPESPQGKRIIDQLQQLVPRFTKGGD